VISASSHAKTGGELQWSNHYASAKNEAAAAQRPLLVVLENPDDPAGRLNTDQIAGDATQVQLLEHYQLCRMDVTTDYGQRVAAAFGAKQFPFTAITDKSARYIMFRSAGPMSTEQWKQTLASRKNGQITRTTADVQRVEASKVITSWPSPVATPMSMPMTQFYSAPSGCPNCAQYYR
jgi:hypothetical protein